jgi:hypothetical protein
MTGNSLLGVQPHELAQIFGIDECSEVDYSYRERFN